MAQEIDDGDILQISRNGALTGQISFDYGNIAIGTASFAVDGELPTGTREKTDYPIDLSRNPTEILVVSTLQAPDDPDLPVVGPLLGCITLTLGAVATRYEYSAPGPKATFSFTFEVA